MLKEGSNNPNWKGGCIYIHGYWYIYKPDHIFATKLGYVMEHRLIYEQYYNCCLLPYTEIHHIDGNRQNNFIENLQPLYKGQHMKLENTINKSNRFCLFCNKKTWKRKDQREMWYSYKNGFICQNCYQKNRRYKKEVKILC